MKKLSKASQQALAHQVLAGVDKAESQRGRRDKVIGYDYLTVEEFREVITLRRLPLPFNLEDIVHQIKQALASDMSPEAIFNLYCTMYNLERDGNYNLRVILNSTINKAVKERRKALTSMIFSK
jgi:hypothetical protein